MSDMIHPGPLLRGVAVHAQPRVLARPQRALAAGRPIAGADAEPVAGAGAAPRVPKPDAQALHVATAPVATMPPGPALDEALAQARAEGLRQGREAGLQLGLKDAQAKLDEANQAAQAAATAKLERELARLSKQWSDRLARLDALVASFEGQVSRCWSHLEVDAAELAFEVACRVLGASAQRRRLIEDMVAQAMSGLRGQPLRVRLSALDLALLDAAEEGGSAGLRARHPGIEWVSDPTVQAGGCLIDGEGGTLDARLDVQLQRLLQQWRAGSPGEAAR
jgi:flagellar biosynthesis/type III secretory pathway protein FliH